MPQKAKIEKFLKKFNITYINVLTTDNKAQLARQLYESLNDIRIYPEDDDDCVKMSNDDLCRYLEMESTLKFYSKKIEEYRKLADDPLPPNSYFSSSVPRTLIRTAIYNTIMEVEEGKRPILYAQSHWMAIHRVLEYHDLCCGTLKDFYDVMTEWFPLAPHPCDYDSLKNVKVKAIRNSNYKEWSAKDRANIPYRRIAIKLAEHLTRAKVI